VISPLTNEEPSAGVNMRCLIDDEVANEPSDAKVTLVSFVMKGLCVGPKMPIVKLLKFRKSRADQLKQLSGLFDELKKQIDSSSSRKEQEDAAKKLFENTIEPELQSLQKELDKNEIPTTWKGFIRSVHFMASAAGLASMVGLSGPAALGAGAFITMADIGRSVFNLSRVKRSPYTYLLNAKRKFSLHHN
jgi:hypothetical protein